MKFYLAAVDDLLRHADDQPSIGLIICKTKNQIVAEYALRNSTTPIGISEYQVAESLPVSLEGSLPTIEQLENELGKETK
jgi:YhcG PDDEXK nuclease domain